MGIRASKAAAEAEQQTNSGVMLDGEINKLADGGAKLLSFENYCKHVLLEGTKDAISLDENTKKLAWKQHVASLAKAKNEDRESANLEEYVNKAKAFGQRLKEKLEDLYVNGNRNAVQQIIGLREQKLEQTFGSFRQLLTEALQAEWFIPSKEGVTYLFAARSLPLYKHLIKHAEAIIQKLIASAQGPEDTNDFPDDGGDTQEPGISGISEIIGEVVYEGYDSEEAFWNEPDELRVEGSFAVPYAQTAQQLFGAMAKSREFFIRGGELVRIDTDDKDRGYQFNEVTEQSMRSIAPTFFKKVSAINCKVDGDRTTWSKKQKNLPRDFCAAILVTDERMNLPGVNVISAAPILYENPSKSGEVILCREGHTDDVMGGVFVTGGESIAPKNLESAVALLLNLFKDFDFLTEADKARAIAMLITPALVKGGLVGGSVPMDFAEADVSQAGKGYRHKLVTAVYNETPSIASQRKGGVGSFDESVGEALLRGRPFIKLDNLRGELDSTTLEAILTADQKEYILARGFGKQADVRAGVYLFQASSNGAQGTRDIANRSCIIRIRKRPDNYQFDTFKEGDLLDHVRANQGLYLGAVHAVVEAWIKQGKQETNEGRHDFRKWVRKLDWIMTNIFGLSGMMDGRRSIQTRVSTPILGAMRELAFAAKKSGRLEEWMPATELIEFAENQNVKIPNIPEKGDDDKKSRWLGTQLKPPFDNEGGDKLPLEEFVMSRDNRDVRRMDGKGFNKKWFYQFELATLSDRTQS
jgi:hypothetical protein